MLGVDRVVLDGGVEPEPVALVAVVERPLERLPPAPRARGLRVARAGGAWACRLVVGVVASVGVVVLGFVLRRLVGLLLGLERGGDERVVLGAQVQLLVDGGPGEALVTVSGGIVGHQLVLALEGADVPDGHLELVRDPGVGATLAHPGADLVELRF